MTTDNDRRLGVRTRRGRGEAGGAGIWVVAAVVVLAVGGVFLWQGRGESGAETRIATWTAKRDKLRISVIESGQLKANKSVDIFCEVRGGSTILELVDEGTRVAKGDLLVRLDDSGLEDDLTAQKIRFQQASAALTQAEKELEIQKSMNESDLDKGQLELDLARTDLEKYEKGDYQIQKQQAESEILLAASELENAKQTEEDTRELVELDFAAKTELDRDELEAKRAEVRHEMSKLERDMLEQYEKKRQIQVLTSAVDQAVAELDRIRLRCDADLAQKVADFESKKATFELEESKLRQLEEQMVNTVIHAPTDGLVVYPVNQGGMGGRGGSDRDRVEEGAQVREHQLLISLPDTSEMVVVVTVHESAIDKLVLGQPTIVTIDANASLNFVGKVSFIAPLPDAQNQWLNPDLKVYRAEVTIGGDSPALRPGMSASVEIVIDELTDVIAAPIHSVRREGERFYVYVVDADRRPQVREVKIGAYNDERVAITEGLSEGETIFLSVPAGAPKPDFPVDEKRAQAQSVDELRRQAEAITTRVPKIPGRTNGDGEAAPEAGTGAAPAINPADMAKFGSMTPEERQKAFQEMLDKMSPEDRAKWEERMKQMREGGGFGGRGGRGAGGADAAGGSN